VNQFFNSGLAPNPLPIGPLAFFAPTVDVTIEAGQSILVTSQAALGSTAGGGGSTLTLAICYSIGGGVPIQVGGVALGLRVPSNTRVNFPMTTIISGFAPGTYAVGLCGQTSSSGWNSNHLASTTAIVFN
jgi:hypothetical protein